MISIPQRAAPLPPEERRAALIASTLALVLTHGPDVNTRQIAQAAGVAEGTIFRVFSTKDELVNAAIASAFDPAPLLRDLAGIDRETPLRTRLVAAVEALRRRMTNVFRLMDALGMAAPTTTGDNHRAMAEQNALIQRTLTELIDPDHALLRCAPSDVARRVQLLTVAFSHPRLTGDDPLPSEEIVATLLDGIRLRPDSGTLPRDDMPPAPVPRPEHEALPSPAPAGGCPC